MSGNTNGAPLSDTSTSYTTAAAACTAPASAAPYSASYSAPTSLALSPNGNVLYVADTLCNVIRAIDVSTTSGYFSYASLTSHPRAPAFDFVGRSPTGATGPATAGLSDNVGTSATITAPQGLAVDSITGFVFFTEGSSTFNNSGIYTNARVRRAVPSSLTDAAAAAYTSIIVDNAGYFYGQPGSGVAICSAV